jgi:hypothetical protein
MKRRSLMKSGYKTFRCICISTFMINLINDKFFTMGIIIRKTYPPYFHHLGNTRMYIRNLSCSSLSRTCTSCQRSCRHHEITSSPRSCWHSNNTCITVHFLAITSLERLYVKRSILLTFLPVCIFLYVNRIQRFFPSSAKSVIFHCI